MIKDLSVLVLCSVGLATLILTRTQGVGACPQGWWAIPNERCVKVFPDKKTLQDAADICRLVESELLSASEEVLQHYIFPIATSMGVPQVLLGVTDPWDTGVFLWLDGSLFNDSMWADENPKPSGGRCAVFRTQERGLVNVYCSISYAFICQKSRSFTGCYNAWYFGSYLSVVVPLDTDVLTLQVCVQVCRGQHVNVGAVWRSKCYCFTNQNVPLAARTYTRRCHATCPGNKAQRCGDVVGQYLTLLDVGRYEDVIGSCAALYRQGVRIPGPYVLQRDEDTSPSIHYCYYTDLQVNAAPRLEYAPEDWLYWKGNFYQFVVATPNVFSIYNGCCFEAGGGYLTSVLSRDELDFIATTIRGSPFFAPIGQWLVGLTDVTLSDYLRWADTALYDNNPSFSNLCTATTPCCVVRSDDSVILRDCITTSITSLGYICKQERGFRGCRKLHLTSMEVEHSADTDDMTALLCKELCRGRLTEHAVVSGSDCYCVTEIPASVDLVTPGHCYTSCPGHQDQMCAGGEFGLWYNVDADKVEDVELATDCDQFLYNGINTLDTLLLQVTQGSGQEALTQSVCGIESDLGTTLTPSSSHIESLSLLSLSKRESVLSTDSIIQDYSKLRLESERYTSQGVSRSRYISTSTLSVQPTSTVMKPSGIDLSAASLDSESISDTIRGHSVLKVLAPSTTWTDSSSIKPTNPQSPHLFSADFSSLITSQKLVSIVVGPLLEQLVSQSSVIGKNSQTSLILATMVSPASEAVHTIYHKDMLYSIPTSPLISDQATSGHTTDVDSGDTSAYPDITSSSTTDLIPKTSEPVSHTTDVDTPDTSAYPDITSSSTMDLLPKTSEPVSYTTDVDTPDSSAYPDITSSSTTDLLPKTSEPVSHTTDVDTPDSSAYPDITSSSTTDLLPKTSEPVSHTTDVDTPDTSAYPDITSSSTMDLLPKTSEPVSYTTDVDTPDSSAYPDITSSSTTDLLPKTSEPVSHTTDVDTPDSSAYPDITSSSTTDLLPKTSEPVSHTTDVDTPDSSAYPDITSSSTTDLLPKTSEPVSHTTDVDTPDSSAYPDITSSSTTDLLPKTSEPVSHTSDVDSEDTSAYPDITSSSTTDLLPKTSEPVSHTSDVDTPDTSAYPDITSSSTTDLLPKTSEPVSYTTDVDTPDSSAYPDITSSSTTDLLPKTPEPVSHTTDVDSRDTSAYPDNTSSSTTDNGDLLSKTSEPVSPTSTNYQFTSDTTTSPMIAASSSEAITSPISPRSNIYTCSSNYSENEANDCPCLWLLTNALTSSCQATLGTSVVLTCRRGWDFTGGQSNITVVCRDGKWNPEPQHCVPGKCELSTAETWRVSTCLTYSFTEWV